jgi:hypothetical protein
MAKKTNVITPSTNYINAHNLKLLKMPFYLNDIMTKVLGKYLLHTEYIKNTIGIMLQRDWKIIDM